MVLYECTTALLVFLKYNFQSLMYAKKIDISKGEIEFLNL